MSLREAGRQPLGGRGVSLPGAGRQPPGGGASAPRASAPKATYAASRGQGGRAQAARQLRPLRLRLSLSLRIRPDPPSADSCATHPGAGGRAGRPGLGWLAGWRAGGLAGRPGRGGISAPAVSTPGAGRLASGPFSIPWGVWARGAGPHGGSWPGDLRWRGRGTGRGGAASTRGEGALPSDEVHHGGR